MQRARFESDLRDLLGLSGIRLVSVAAGEDEKTKEGVWVFTVHDGAGAITIRSSRGELADIGNGVVRTVRDLRAKEAASGGGSVQVEHEAAPAAIEERELTFEEKVLRAEEARRAAGGS